VLPCHDAYLLSLKWVNKIPKTTPNNIGIKIFSGWKIKKPKEIFNSAEYLPCKIAII